MPADMKCEPGQTAPVLANSPVVLTRAGGFPEQQGTVKLLATGYAKGSAPIEPKKWTSAAIAATVPAVAPGDPPYYIRVESNNQSFEGLLDIRALSDDNSGYPPSRG
jgi:hypothetical protein